MMEIKKHHQIGMGIGLAIIGLAFLFQGTLFFSLIVGIGIIIGASPFVFSTVVEARAAAEKESMFLEVHLT